MSNKKFLRFNHWSIFMNNAEKFKCWKIFHVGGSYETTERWDFIDDPNSDSDASSDFERVTLSVDLVTDPKLCIYCKGRLLYMNKSWITV